MVNHNCCDIWSKFGLVDNQLVTNNDWTVLLRPKQVTIGSCVLIANRHVESVAELKDTEATSFVEIVAQLEILLKRKLEYDRINYLALMMKDPHLHFHVIPRYESDRIIAGHSYKDETWPKPPNMSVSIGDASLLDELRKLLRS